VREKESGIEEEALVKRKISDVNERDSHEDISHESVMMSVSTLQSQSRSPWNKTNEMIDSEMSVDETSLSCSVKEGQESSTLGVDENEVHKLCESKWEHVNGTYDSETEWREWNEMTSGVSYGGELIHILPYVNINW